ncbi:MAG: D-hexose-6-phosphate mutarotase [Verrucomicrobia bacterium]|nr:D-hexose-6-phosphate mutarotase [Verrucomicrobiota bacterium]
MNTSKSESTPSPTPHGRVTFLEGRGDLPMVEITTPWSTAGIYLHGAQVTHFQKQGEPPLLFLSQCSRFDTEHPIRGGIPIIFPWFGKPADKTGQHGFARVRDWELCEVTSPADGSVTLRLRLPECGESADCAACAVEYVVTVSDMLTAELRVSNKSGREFEFENCLHTYFAVGDIQAVKVTGLKGVEYLNQPTGFSQHTETADAIRFGDEVDRIYLATGHPVEILDERLKRIIRVEKEGSNSTVVWNPWIAKAKAMPDYGDEEFKEMVCVESGNVAANRVILPPGQTSRLKIKLSSRSLV